MTNRRSSTSGPTPLRDIVDTLGDSLLQRAQWLDKVNQRLLALLPPLQRPHVRVANVKDGILVLQVDSPVWNAKMRYQSDTVLDAARQIGLDVRSVRVKVEPPQAPVVPVAPTSSPMPKKVMDEIEQVLGLREISSSGKQEPTD